MIFFKEKGQVSPSSSLKLISYCKDTTLKSFGPEDISYLISVVLKALDLSDNAASPIA